MPALLNPGDLKMKIDDSSDEASGFYEYQEVLMQQSVTMLAYMDNTVSNATEMAEEPKMMLGFSLNDFSVLVGAAIGASALLIIIIGTLIAWHCCRMQRRPFEAYCLDNSSPDISALKQCKGSMLQSDSVVFLGNKANQIGTRAVGLKHEICRSILTRSHSVPLRKDREPLTTRTMPRIQSSKKRPISQPVHLPITFQSPSKRICSQYQRHLDELDTAVMPLPSIPEGISRSSERMDGVAPTSAQYASCNALNEVVCDSQYNVAHANSTMKTRSLPLWGRSKARPLSTEDDLKELYAKVNFSKKRKNRMRSDSAAAIAVIKTCTVPFKHKDTASLVQNEAVVVYDERTSL